MRGEMPERLFVGPSGGKTKKKFLRIVLAVDDWDAKGRPKKFTRIRGHTEAADRGSSDFMIAYVPEGMIEEERGAR